MQSKANYNEEIVVPMQGMWLHSKATTSLIIVNSGKKSANLETENKVLKEQLEQMKRVVLNMNNALKAKQG